MIKPNNLSILDGMQVIKNVHNYDAEALKVINSNSEVPGGYSRVEFTKNLAGSITKAVFYIGTQSQKTRIKFVDDVSGSLSGTYWDINTVEDGANIRVWYNNGLGAAPSDIGKILLEIPYTNNDPASIICLLTKRYLETLLSFNIETNGDTVLLITNTVEGETTNSSAGTSPFALTTLNEGVTKRYKTVELPEDPKIKYIFNYGERKFEIASIISVSGDVNATIVNPLPLPVTFQGLTIESATVLNVAAPVAGTEYTFTIPVGAKRFEVAARSGLAKVQYCFSAGQSAIDYKTLRAGSVWEEPNLFLVAGLDVYFQTNKNGEVLEISIYS
jgi:hypothetical protein